MSPAPQQLEELKWFKRNLELQLEDIEFERRGKKIALYFDTADVQRAVLGLKAYYDPNNLLRVAFFTSDKTLVDCLIASGLLGPFQMVPPHLSEFSHKVENRFDIGPTLSWDQEAKKFLKDVGLIGQEDIALENLNDQEVSTLTAHEIDNAPLWFKAINCLLPWHRRLNIWLHRNLLTLDSSPMHSRALVSSPDFPVLKKLFDDTRPGWSVNNFVDTLAISYLITLTTRLKQEESDVVPRFFIPSGEHTFKSVLDKAKLHSKLSCPHPVTNQESSIFRDADYYKFKLTFRRDLDGLNRASALSPEEHEMDLRKLYEIVTNSIEGTRGLSERETIQYAHNLDYVYQGRSLSELIKDLQGVAFISANTFKMETDKEFLGIIKQMKEVAEIVARQSGIHEDERVQENVMREFNRRNKDLDDSLKEFKWFSLMWEAVHSRGTQTLTKRLQNFNETERQDYFREFGLLRYGFPREMHKRITRILSNLCSGSSDEILKGSADTLKAYVNGRKDQPGDEGHLIVATAILMAQRLEPQLLELLETKEKSLTHFSLRVAFGELLFRIGERKTDASRVDKASQVLAQLREEFERKEEGVEKAYLAVGIAYLSYRAWSAYTELLKRSETDSEDLQNRAKEEIQRATEYANYAYESLTDRDSSAKAYALNQYLFYALEGELQVPFEQLQVTADKLKQYKLRQHDWQFRFDDTLARYYDKAANVAPNVKYQKQLLEMAVMYGEAAFDKSDDDEEVKSFYLHVKDKLLNLSMKYPNDLEPVN